MNQIPYPPASLPLVIVFCVLLAVCVVWFFLPILLLSRLSKMHATLEEISTRLYTVERAAHLQLPASAKGQSSASYKIPGI